MPSPAWVALIEQMPAATTRIAPDSMVQVFVVSDAKVTGYEPMALLDAVRDLLLLVSDISVGWAKVMACDNFAPVVANR